MFNYHLGYANVCKWVMDYGALLWISIAVNQNQTVNTEVPQSYDTVIQGLHGVRLSVIPLTRSNKYVPSHSASALMLE